MVHLLFRRYLLFWSFLNIIPTTTLTEEGLRKMGLIVLETIAIMTAGMMVGNELCAGVISSRLRRLDDHTHFEAARMLAATFGALMPFWYAATLLLTGVVAFSLRVAGKAAVLAEVSAALWLFSIVYTLIGLVPINNRIAAWSWGTQPDDWTETRQKIQTRHSIRVALLTIAFTCLVWSCLSVQP